MNDSLPEGVGPEAYVPKVRLRGRPRKLAAQEYLELRPAGDEPQTLLDLRHAYYRPASEDRTPGQMAARRMFDADAGKFMDRLNAAESGYRKDRVVSSSLKDGGSEGVLVDAGAERVEELLLRLLRGTSE